MTYLNLMSWTDRFGSLIVQAFICTTVILFAALFVVAVDRSRSAAFRHRVWGSTLATSLILVPLLALLPSLGPAWLVSEPDPMATSTPKIEAPISESVHVDAPIPAEKVPQPVAVYLPNDTFSSSILEDPPAAILDTSAGASSGTQEKPKPAFNLSLLPTPAPNPHTIWFFVWLTGCTLAAFPLGKNYVRLRRIVRNSVDVKDGRALGLLEELRADFGLSARIALLRSDTVKVPFASGTLRPTIVVPAGFAAYTSERQRLILVHEMAHIRRQDVAWQWLARFAGVVYWCHPLVRWAERRMRIEREFACDDAVVHKGEAAANYATHLVDVAAQVVQPELQRTMVAMASNSSVERRVKGLLMSGRNRSPLSRRAGQVLLAMTLAAAISTCLARPGSSQVPTGPERNTAQIAQQLLKDSHQDDGLLTLAAIVTMPDGLPAPNATVRVRSGNYGIEESVTDANGVAVVRDVFFNGVRVYARSADGKHQSVWQSESPDTRNLLSKPISIELAPAASHTVTVLRDAKPVGKATVMGEGTNFVTQTKTDSTGVAKLLYPANAELDELVAWHSTLGVNGIRNSDNDYRKRETQVEGDSSTISLRPPAPLTIRLLDQNEDPVPGIKMGVSVRPEKAKWIVVRDIVDSQVTTDANGEAVVNWAPTEIGYVEPNLLTKGWKRDSTDVDRVNSHREVVVHIRRLHAVTGKLVMPAGANPSGILVGGFGFGIGNNGHIPRTRVRKDGSFHFLVPSDHGYVLGIVDNDWAAPLWTGKILSDDDAEQAEITLEAAPAIPIEVSVTRGADHQPVADAWIDVSMDKSFEWTDSTGEERRGTSGPSKWLKTDANGMARVGVGLGDVELRVDVGDWSEEKKFEVKSDKPIRFEFHRPWQGERVVTATIEAPDTLSTNTKVLAWSVGELDSWDHSSREETAEVKNPSTVEVKFDEKHLYLAVIDEANRRSGLVYFDPSQETKSIKLVDFAKHYSGQFLDENGKPLANREVKLLTETEASFLDLGRKTRTDEEGRFAFDDLPAQLPIRVSFERKTVKDPREYFLFDCEKLFEPGEVRKNVVLKPSRRDAPESEKQAASKRKEIALAKRVAEKCLHASVSHMRALAIVQGSSKSQLQNVTNNILDYDDYRIVTRYLPITVTQEQVQKDLEYLAKNDWPVPESNQIALLVLDDDGSILAAETIDTQSSEQATKYAIALLEENARPARDAHALLADAKAEAVTDGKRIWLVEGGPRCGPCFRFSAWIHEHRAVLEKDYIFVKLMGSVDDNVREVVEQFQSKRGGVPWHTIIDSDGSQLITSNSPLGNIGMPGSVEGKRHLRKMLEATARRISKAEIDHLIDSLP